MLRNDSKYDEYTHGHGNYNTVWIWEKWYILQFDKSGLLLSIDTLCENFNYRLTSSADSIVSLIRGDGTLIIFNLYSHNITSYSSDKVSLKGINASLVSCSELLLDQNIGNAATYDEQTTVMRLWDFVRNDIRDIFLRKGPYSHTTGVHTQTKTTFVYSIKNYHIGLLDIQKSETSNFYDKKEDFYYASAFGDRRLLMPEEDKLVFARWEKDTILIEDSILIPGLMPDNVRCDSTGKLIVYDGYPDTKDYSQSGVYLAKVINDSIVRMPLALNFNETEKN